MFLIKNTFLSNKVKSILILCILLTLTSCTTFDRQVFYSVKHLQASRWAIVNAKTKYFYELPDTCFRDSFGNKLIDFKYYFLQKNKMKSACNSLIPLDSLSEKYEKKLRRFNKNKHKYY